MSQVNKNKRGSYEGGKNVARRIGRAKERVRQQDYDKAWGPATMSPTANALRKAAQRKQITAAGNKSAAEYEKKNKK